MVVTFYRLTLFAAQTLEMLPELSADDASRLYFTLLIQNVYAIWTSVRCLLSLRHCYIQCVLCEGIATLSHELSDLVVEIKSENSTQKRNCSLFSSFTYSPITMVHPLPPTWTSWILPASTSIRDPIPYTCFWLSFSCGYQIAIEPSMIRWVVRAACECGG